MLGGNQAWHGTAEVTVPLVEKIRGALFYDIGEVSDGPAGSVGGGVNSDWGVGVRMFILGSSPVRLDYAFPLQADAYHHFDAYHHYDDDLLVHKARPIPFYASWTLN